MISEENKQKIMNAVKDILEAVGEDVNRPGLAETPKRVANMYEEMFAGLDSDATQHLKLFDEKSNDEMVIVRDIINVRASPSALYGQGTHCLHSVRQQNYRYFKICKDSG